MRKLNWLLLLGLLAGCESLTIDSGPEDDDVAAHTQFTAPTYDGDAEAADQEHSRRAREIYLGGVAALQASPPDVDRAMRDFQLALAADPLFYKAHFKLGICYYLQGKYHLEINEYKLCLATNRNYVPAWLNLGHAYLGITDHSQSSFQADGLDPERLLKQVAEVRALDEEFGDDFTLFAAVECDIRSDGALDYEEDVLAELDYLIVSLHSGFVDDREKMTRRAIKAIEHPRSRIFAHPTGRLLLKREPYPIDLGKVIDAAAANDVAIEFNCHPMRLDMDWTWWQRARDAGVHCSLNPDAHSLPMFDYVDLGVGFARKGWLRADDIINCWDTQRLRDFFAG